MKVHNSDILYYPPLRNQILGSHLEIQVILRLLHLWSTKTAVGKAQDEVKVSALVIWEGILRLDLGRVYLDSLYYLFKVPVF